LKNDPHWYWVSQDEWCEGCQTQDPLQKEFIDLLEKAKKIYAKEKRRRKV
jgi:hypothetical protein